MIIQENPGWWRCWWCGGNNDIIIGDRVNDDDGEDIPMRDCLGWESEAGGYQGAITWLAGGDCNLQPLWNAFTVKCITVGNVSIASTAICIHCEM